MNTYNIWLLNSPVTPAKIRLSRRDDVVAALWVWMWTPLRIYEVSGGSRGGSRGGRDADLGGFVFFGGEEIYEERM